MIQLEMIKNYFPAEKIILTGNPIRQNLLLPEKRKKESMDHFKLNHGKKVILLIGGSIRVES